jgi:uncharacterized membrane protein YraQ (UPF0718 family)
VGDLVELIFGVTGLIPGQRDAKVMAAGISWNYTTWLNIIFLVLAAVLILRFMRTGGIAMLRMMGGAPEHDDSHHAHDAQTEQKPTSSTDDHES